MTVPRPRGECTPGVTIAIPNWNHELVLPRAVGSALEAAARLRESGAGAEVLVADDESRDGSVTLLRQLEALHHADGLRAVCLDPNAGLARVRNRALAEAAYRHVLFLDADNELLPDNLPLFYRAATATGAAAVYGNLLTRQGGSSDGSVMSNESFQTRMFVHNYVDAFALFDAVQVSELGGYTADDRVRAREDWELYLHLAASGREVVFVPAVLGYYHDAPGSMIKQSAGHHAAQAAHLRRAFDQFGARGHLPLNTLHKTYHPDIGYL
jgi:glycosyltransferase involved in cell wall biosynthesis